MQRVGIITLNGYKNYGNRLQNYALVTFIEKQGVVAENIWDVSFKRRIKNKVKSILPLKRFKRFSNFYKFNNKIRTNYVNDFNKLNDKYDCFIVGSDQTWNPFFGGTCRLFLKFADDYKKNSYSASIGTEEIPEELKNKYIENLEKFNMISVREDAGKKIVESLTDRCDVEVLIDPTMLLTASEWDIQSKCPHGKLPRKYILNYFLGSISEERRKVIEKIASKHNCKIINLLDKKSPYYHCGPSEFLYLEKNAFLICTDSFHSSVFALLFDKPFVVFDREEENMNNMGSRIDTLISKFKLKNRKYNGKEITDENLRHDYSKSYEILEMEREKSRDFINKILKGK